MTRDRSDMDALSDAITTLSVVLEHENAALLESDFSVSGVLAGAKRDAIGALETIAAAGTATGGALSARPDNRMIVLQRRLDDAISKNRILLQRSIDTQQRVIATVVRALDPAEEDCAYPTQNGSEAGHRSAMPVALVLRA